MQDSIQISKVVRFETFELNLRTGELRKGGVRIRLQEQSFQVLVALLERPGKLVTREALRERLWPDGTFVDFEKSLNIAVSKLRQALGDSADEPRFIETLPRRGYRFIGPVEQLDASGGIVGLPEGTATKRTISHYRLLEKLGQGGMGVVYKALDTKLKRPVALKFLRADIVEDAEAKERFLREAQAAAALDHPNICTVYEIDEADGQTFLAMAFVAGRTIKDKINGRPLKLEEVLGIATQTAEGLKAAHQKGVVHRDIKPANLILTEEGQVKIMDFGLAQLAEQSRLTKTATILGTPAYVSPEQTRRKPTDRRTDVWSLGVVIYEMVTGRLPFAGERQEAVLYAIGNEDPEPITALRAGLPIELDFIVGKALAKDPADRYQHVDEVLVDLRGLQKKREPALTKPLAVPAGAPAGRWSWYAGAAALAVLLLLAAVFGSRLLGPSAPDNQPPLRAVPLTTFQGHETDPTLSPDGSQVAFAWNGENQQNFDIYAQVIGSANPLRLTTDPAPDVGPAWSPDGRQIAFVRFSTAGSAVYVIPPPGGPERKVTEFLSLDSSIAWGVDSKWLVVAGTESVDRPVSLYKVFVDSGEKQRLTSTSPSSRGDRNPAISPDGQTIAFTRWTSVNNHDILLLSLDGREPRQLSSVGASIYRLAWTAEGREIVFSRTASYRGARSLWRCAPGNDEPGARRHSLSEHFSTGASGVRERASRLGRLVVRVAVRAEPGSTPEADCLHAD